MRFYITSRGRPNNVRTWGYLPDSVRKVTQVVVIPEEKKAYEKFPTLVLPEAYRLSDTREWLLHHHLETYPDDPYMVLLDDDLRFAKRRTDHYPDRFATLYENNDEDREVLRELFNEVYSRLKEGYAHVGVCPREGGNRLAAPMVENKRYQRVLAYNVQTLLEEGIIFNRLPVMSDYDVALQLLRKGHPSCIVTTFCQGHTTSNDKGGVSIYRDESVQERGAKGLQSLHPDFVKTVEKETKSGWFGGKRLDVMIQWKKAYESGVEMAEAADD